MSSFSKWLPIGCGQFRICFQHFGDISKKFEFLPISVQGRALGPFFEVLRATFVFAGISEAERNQKLNWYVLAKVLLWGGNFTWGP